MTSVEKQLSLFPYEPSQIKFCEDQKAPPQEMPATGLLFPVLAFDASRIENSSFNRRSSDFEITSDSAQLLFGFLEDNIAQFGKYIRKDRNGLLDKDMLSFCAREPRLHKLSFKLYDVGVKRIGHLVQLSRDDIRRQVGASDAALDRLERLLANADLGLGMKTLAWNPSMSRTT